MSHTLTRKNISAIARLDFSGLGHAQRIDAIAQALGYATGAALMAKLKKSEQDCPQNQKEKYCGVYVFGEELSNSVESYESIDDKYGDFEVVEFDTAAELSAYDQGVADASGWLESFCLAQSNQNPKHKIFKILETEPDINKAYEIMRAEYLSEDDEE